MEPNVGIDALVAYGLRVGLLEPEDRVVAVNRLLEALQLEEYTPARGELPRELEDILAGLTEDAVQRGICQDNSVARDLLDTKLMGTMTPMSREVAGTFRRLYESSPEAATDWYYQFSQNTDYIRRYRIRKDLKWIYPGEYGDLEITVNLSKPEKDPRAIAAARLAPQSGYPKCQLCLENAGYAGRMNHPARQNHRPVPVEILGQSWHMQFSPYVYYNEHCIVFNDRHVPMEIHRSAFEKLLDFTRQFPHYFLGSNADLPIVGGSILSHEHFQGGRHDFAMAKAPVEESFRFPGFGDVQAGMVKWPMSVVRLRGQSPGRLALLGERILDSWRGYSDPGAEILARSNGQPHNTITPVARRRGAEYELDLVLRNNRTTPEHPLGLFHPHEDKHHIKKENIGLIEVMGLAVLPSRLKGELAALEQAIRSGIDPASVPELEKHAAWVAELRLRHDFAREDISRVLQQEVGLVFSRVLEDAGVFKRTGRGKAAFRRFLAQVPTQDQ